MTPDEPLGLFSFFPGRSFPLRPSPFLRRSPNVPLALNSTTQVPPSRCRGCRVHSRNEGLAGHRAVCERQATPAALSVATIESAALPENTTSDGLHAGLRPGGAREKPVYSIAGTHTCASLLLCSTWALQMPPKVCGNRCRLGHYTQCFPTCWICLLQAFPQVSILVAAGKAHVGRSSRSLLSFFFSFLTVVAVVADKM